MDFLPFLREASEYSAGWIAVVWGFLGLQMEMRQRNASGKLTEVCT